MSHIIEPGEPKSPNTTIMVAIISGLATIIVALITTFKDPITEVIFKTPTLIPTPSFVIASSTATSLPVLPSDTPTQINTLSTTPSATATSTPITTPTLFMTIPETKYSPLITDIQTRKSLTSEGVRIYADIYFQDKDGDSYLVTYEVVNLTAKIRDLEDDPIPASMPDQIAGTVVTVHWDCLGKGYVVTLNAKVLDRSGNQSNQYSLVFDCR